MWAQVTYKETSSTELVAKRARDNNMNDLLLSSVAEGR